MVLNKDKNMWRILFGALLVVPLVAYAANQLTYPVDESTNSSLVPAYKFTNTGSRTAMWIIGQQANNDATLLVEATSDGVAGEFKSTSIYGRPAVNILATCAYTACTATLSESTAGTGIQGKGTYYGVYGYGDLAGVHGKNKLTNDGYGVRAEHSTTNGYGAGIYATSQTGPAGLFEAFGSNNNGKPYEAIRATSNFSSGIRSFGAVNGVWGNSSSGSASGVYGENLTGSGFGVAGRTSSGGSAIFGDTGHLSNGFSGNFTGKVQVLGTLSKGGGSFKIDHPLDPQNKFLYHSFVESPDMMNVYNGIVTLDSAGRATVQCLIGSQRSIETFATS